MFSSTVLSFRYQRFPTLKAVMLLIVSVSFGLKNISVVFSGKGEID